MNTNRKGFTLVEIMIVVAIIGILAAIAIPNFIKSRQESQRNACIANLKQIEGAYEQAKLANATVTDVASLVGVDKWIRVNPVCPAGGVYTIPSDSARATCSKNSSPELHVLPAT